MADQLVPHQKERDTGMAYILWLASFVGLAGIHRLYMGRWVSGLIWLFTGGLCMVGGELGMDGGTVERNTAQIGAGLLELGLAFGGGGVRQNRPARSSRLEGRCNNDDDIGWRPVEFDPGHARVERL